MYATLDLWLSSLRSLPGEMDETDALRSKRCNEDAVSLAPSTTESIIVEGEWTESATVSVLVDSLGGYDITTVSQPVQSGSMLLSWRRGGVVESGLISPFFIKLWCVGGTGRLTNHQLTLDEELLYHIFLPAACLLL